MERRPPREELRIGISDDRLEDPTVRRRSLERVVADHRVEAAAGKPRRARRTP